MLDEMLLNVGLRLHPLSEHDFTKIITKINELYLNYITVYH